MGTLDQEVLHQQHLTLSWDGKDRGKVTVSKGVPQGSPLSAILFLAYIAPMVRKLEKDLSIASA